MIVTIKIFQCYVAQFYYVTTLIYVHQFNETNVQYKIICELLEFA